MRAVSKKTKWLIFFFVFIFLAGLLFSYTSVQATDHHPGTGGEQYQLLTPLGGIVSVDTSPGGFQNYAGNIFRLLVGIAGVLAVLMIVIGGIQYMTSDAFTSKEAAKKRIWAAITGLLLAIASFLILQTINPNLLNLNLDIPEAGLPSTPSDPDNEPPSRLVLEYQGFDCFLDQGTPNERNHVSTSVLREFFVDDVTGCQSRLTGLRRDPITTLSCQSVQIILRCAPASGEE